MDQTLPIENPDQEPIIKNRLLYMGTTLFQKVDDNFDEKDITLSYLQDTIAQRYPVDGSNFAKGLKKFRIFKLRFKAIDSQLQA